MTLKEIKLQISHFKGNKVYSLPSSDKCVEIYGNGLEWKGKEVVKKMGQTSIEAKY